MTKRVTMVCAPDADWAQQFARERALLAGALGEVAVLIEHIGSTAVPGLAAKPVIDMQMTVRDLASLDARSAVLEQLGYQVRGENGIPGRRYFCKGGAQRTHHLHAFEQGDVHLRQHRVFRDYLIAHPAVARSYGDLKKTLAQLHAQEPARYQEGKDAFVREHLDRALCASDTDGRKSE